MELVNNHGHIAKYIYVPHKFGTSIRQEEDILFYFRCGWFECFMQMLTPMPEKFSEDWECYEIYSDGFARRRVGVRG